MPGSSQSDRYAGDDAWRDWFERCAVSRCPSEEGRSLRRQIESALVGQLSRWGLSRDDMGSDDPIAFFDSYFQLKGSRDSPKPLKAYFAHRIVAEGLRLRDFVCGTLFGSGSGRVRDIAVDWIAANKGWKPRTVTDRDGRRHFEWENAVEELPGDEREAKGCDPAAFLDDEPLREIVAGLLAKVSCGTGVEKSKVALLSLATALDISLAEPAILSGLGTGKSRAYVLKEKVMAAMKLELEGLEGADDPLFGRILLEMCEASLDPSVRRSLEEPL